jgi:hypothetical protein
MSLLLNSGRLHAALTPLKVIFSEYLFMYSSAFAHPLINYTHSSLIILHSYEEISRFSLPAFTDLLI